MESAIGVEGASFLAGKEGVQRACVRPCVPFMYRQDGDGQRVRSVDEDIGSTVKDTIAIRALSKISTLTNLPLSQTCNSVDELVRG